MHCTRTRVLAAQDVLPLAVTTLACIWRGGALLRALELSRSPHVTPAGQWKVAVVTQGSFKLLAPDRAGKAALAVAHLLGPGISTLIAGL